MSQNRIDEILNFGILLGSGSNEMREGVKNIRTIKNRFILYTIRIRGALFRNRVMFKIDLGSDIETIVRSEILLAILKNEISFLPSNISISRSIDKLSGKDIYHFTISIS